MSNDENALPHLALLRRTARGLDFAFRVVATFPVSLVGVSAAYAACDASPSTDWLAMSRPGGYGDVSDASLELRTGGRLRGELTDEESLENALAILRAVERTAVDAEDAGPVPTDAGLETARIAVASALQHLEIDDRSTAIEALAAWSAWSGDRDELAWLAADLAAWVADRLPSGSRLAKRCSRSAEALLADRDVRVAGAISRASQARPGDAERAAGFGEMRCVYAVSDSFYPAGGLRVNVRTPGDVRAVAARWALACWQACCADGCADGLQAEIEMADGRLLVVTRAFEFEGWAAVDEFLVDEQRRGRPPRRRRDLSPEQRRLADDVHAELRAFALRLARERRTAACQDRRCLIRAA